MTAESYFLQDIKDFLYLLYKHKVQYLIIGGEAVIYYGHARLTGDIDIFYERETENINNLFNALKEFWNNDILGISGKEELMQRGMVFQFGIPPNRIDLFNIIESVTFKKAWENKKTETIPDKKKIEIYYIGLNELIKNKKAIDRYKNKEDLKFLMKSLKE